MPVRSDGRREPVGAQPGRAHRVQPAEQFGVRHRVPHRALPAVDRHMGVQPLPQPARHRLQQRLRRRPRVRSAIWQTPADTWPARAGSRPAGGPPRARAAATGRPSRPSPRPRSACPSSIGSPRSAASRTLAGEVQATIDLGPRRASRPAPPTGAGTTGTSRKPNRSPSAATRRLAQPAQQQIERLRERRSRTPPGRRRTPPGRPRGRRGPRPARTARRRSGAAARPARRAPPDGRWAARSPPCRPGSAGCGRAAARPG